jgi:hypothetical protein
MISSRASTVKVENKPVVVKISNKNNLPTEVKTVTIPSIKGISQLPISSGSRLVFLGILSFSNRENLCWMSKSSLCERSNVKRHNINRYLDELIQWGFIQYVDQKKIRVNPMISFQKEVIVRNQPVSAIPQTVSLGHNQTVSQGHNPPPQTVSLGHTKVLREGNPKKENNRSSDPLIFPPGPRERMDHFKEKESESSFFGKGEEFPDEIPEKFKINWSQGNLVQNKILLDKCSKKMKEIKNQYFFDGSWDDKSKKVQFKQLKSFVQWGNNELYGMDLS